MQNNSDETLEWVWDANETTSNIRLKSENQEVLFHPSYSSGTATVRGTRPCIAGRNYYWEIEILTPLYGTDVMIGVGTHKVNLKKHLFEFSSLLGSDGESWGYSYRGFLQHKGVMKRYGYVYGKGNSIGIHLDMWLGSLTFYLNRRPLGLAFTKLKKHVLYPMACSTAARSAMRIVYAISYTTTLQFRCLLVLGKKHGVAKKLESIPGLKEQVKRTFWLFPSPEEIIEGEEMDLFWCEDEDNNEQRVPAIEGKFSFLNLLFQHPRKSSSGQVTGNTKRMKRVLPKCGAEPATNPSLVRLRDEHFVANPYDEYYFGTYLENNVFTSLNPDI